MATLTDRTTAVGAHDRLTTSEQGRLGQRPMRPLPGGRARQSKRSRVAEGAAELRGYMRNILVDKERAL
jgi:hypothetical protein